MRKNQVFLIFANNSNKIKKNKKNKPTHPKFQQKILNSRVVGALQSFQVWNVELRLVTNYEIPRNAFQVLTDLSPIV